ncbi:hypothetical protein GIS00_05170 [Nakamurella sp. YIM 132087]|uniref:peptidylprolyl isomerase n=1 Tax=Nakamurella alba TaxID=2665158 RepID=A0A7K1FGW0_9ACTN|nr:FKBP-type peptidyl-prolyl cis-trans isomerase [Nakamurella alba]MTD13338.1 hypothetical protein [Nakamurella alba]
MRIRAALAALPLSLLVLAACGTDDSATPTTSASASSSGSAVTAATLGPDVPAATALAAAVPAAELPTATGDFGTKATLEFPAGNPVPSLQREILTEGKGAEAEAGDYLEVNYLGQVWGGEVFDNSYDKKQSFSFKIGEGVVSGWSVGLTGVKQGSRVLLSLPPADGYGATGNSDGSIKGTDTIVFVIDVINVIKSDATGQTDATPNKDLPKTGIPKVTGKLGEEPTIEIGDAPEPTKAEVIVLATGTGEKVVAGDVVGQLVVTAWDGSQTTSTWASETDDGADPSTKGLQKITAAVGTDGQESVTEGLIGVPIGSRVMILLPGTSDSTTGQTSTAAVAVMDIVAQVSKTG